LAGVFSVFMALAFASSAHALDWRFEPAVGASATYTDNANQSETDQEDELILTVRPNFTLRSEGSRRIRASVNYGLTGVARFGEDQSTDLNHNLGAIGNAELIEDFLFIDGSARISQELISLFGSPAEAEINDANRATVGTYSISPYIQKRLGTFANAQARYTIDGSIFENDVASDSTANSFSAGLTSGTRFKDLSWGLNYYLRKSGYSGDTADTTFENASATLGYALTRRFRVFGTVGQEWNEYLGASGASSEIDDSYYSVGAGWSPTRRTSVEASVGERYYGNTYSFSGTHRARSSRWTVSYSEDFNDISQQFLAQASRIFWICNDGRLRETPDFNPPAGQTDCVGPISAGQLVSLLGSFGLSNADLVALNLPHIGIANGVYIIKSLNAGVSWDVGRLGFGLSAYDTRRLYQALDEAEDRTQGVTGSVSYQMSPRTTANSTLSLTRNSADAVLEGGTAREDDLLSLSLGLNHEFAEDLNGALIFRHIQRDSNVARSDYEENRLTALVNMRF